WSEWRMTKAGHKLPADWDVQCEQVFLRLAFTIKEHDVPAELYVNTDQTNMVYTQGTKLTWAPMGSKQVSVVSDDEKRAVTLIVSISNSGVLLPFQAVYVGESSRSLPKKTALKYREMQDAGMFFASGGASYWSTQETMQGLVEDIIAPYFAKKKAELGLPESQKAIWQIDAWSVHRSAEFRGYMRKNHPNIILMYIPAGCT
ncbi:hypothetical protein JAAARDRAFT_87431, partial [Jaapia argillacea MUCL 33604]